MKRKFATAVILWIVLITSKVYALPDTTSKMAPYFLVKSTAGETINIAAQKGKVVFLNFWALSCAPCKEEMPSIDALRGHYKNDTNVLIIPVDLDKNPNSIKYMQEKGYGLTIYTSASVVPEALFRGVLPTTVVIDKAGKIVLYHEEKGEYGSKEFFEFMNGVVR